MSFQLPPVLGGSGKPPAHPTHGKSPTARTAWGDGSRSKKLPAFDAATPPPAVSASAIKRGGESRSMSVSPSDGKQSPLLSRLSTPSPKSEEASPSQSPSASSAKAYRYSPAVGTHLQPTKFAPLKKSSSSDLESAAASPATSPSPSPSKGAGLPAVRTPSAPPALELDSDSESAASSPLPPINKRAFKPIVPSPSAALPPLTLSAFSADAVVAPRPELPKAPTMKPSKPIKDDLVVEDFDEIIEPLSIEPSVPAMPAASSAAEPEKLIRECTISAIDADKKLPSITPAPSPTSALFGFTLV
ncbi:MAG TPA: hypothetical protein VLG44_07495 [Chlamydiales bacterium]|nr:hypothetical protein [Chlamydiales bacterium]